jgi:hypothetical protein
MPIRLSRLIFQTRVAPHVAAARDFEGSVSMRGIMHRSGLKAAAGELGYRLPARPAKGHHAG